MTTATIVDSKAQTQSPQVWDKPTAQATTGDYMRVPFAPVMRVVEKDVLENGQVRLLLKPTTGSYSEEWVLEPEQTKRQPAPEPQTQPILNIENPPQLAASTATKKNTAWVATYNSQWGWYEVWLGRKWVGRASTHEEAERVAQKYTAMNELIQRQNESVLAKYAC